MQLSHAPARMSYEFDDPNLIGRAGLVPVLALADRIGLPDLVDQHVRLPGSAGANPACKVMSLVAGMVAGADDITDMDLLRHGGMDKIVTGVRAPSTLGTFLRTFTFGHVRQLDAVAARTLAGLCARAPLLPGIEQQCLIDIDDTVKQIWGVGKQGRQVGYTRLPGLNAQLATVSTPDAAPVIAATRLRRGAAYSGHGAVTMLRETIRTARRCGATGDILVRADSAYYSAKIIHAVRAAGARFSVTARLNPSVVAAIHRIDDTAWTRIDYPWAIPDPDTGELVAAAEVAETEYTAFTSKRDRRPVTARLLVRRIPERNQHKLSDPLFDAYRYHAVFTDSTAPLVTAEATHRGHAVIEQVIADLKNSALAHLPSATFTANAAWLVCAAIAFNLTRAVGVLAGATFTRAETTTIRDHLITIPARTARSARKTRLHLPTDWPWSHPWHRLWRAVTSPG